MTNHLIVMARNPFKSQVKTRLGKSLGTAIARGVYTRLVYETLFTLLSERDNGTAITLTLEAAHGVPIFKEAFPELNVIHQSHGNIGNRMWHEFQAAFEQNVDKAVLIGSDIPGIHWETIQQALNVIDEETIAIGPARDGGYYLIGMQSPGVDVFQDILWSSNTVLAETISNITQNGLLPGFLPILHDIDFLEDLHQWQRQLLSNQPGNTGEREGLNNGKEKE
jgi:rSAM/selenodomain-associated transferase 1